MSEKPSQKFKEEEEKAEQTVNVNGSTSEVRINADTHCKIIVARSTLEMLKTCVKKDDYDFYIGSWDAIILTLIKRIQKYKKTDD